MLQRPLSGDYPPYAENYVNQVPEGSVIDMLVPQLEELVSLLRDVTEEQGNYRYAPGKWTLKEVLGHLADTERIMSYRLLRIARGDTTPLSGFDQDLFMKEAAFGDRTMAELLNELDTVRRATVSMVNTIKDEAWGNRGTFSNHPGTATALLYIIIGHIAHHVNVIKERYLV
ncbi:DinB family protein [Paenibacillus gansuensis]|uniref:DinB family protein n=1 Tax=Paenibacillus gansuensis TaxID=306542 RepID=A0ABW5P8I7_9BACL